MKRHENTLIIKWNKKDKDIEYLYPNKRDGHLLHFYMGVPLDDKTPSLFRELEKRGYDLKTLKFSIKKKTPDKRIVNPLRIKKIPVMTARDEKRFFKWVDKSGRIPTFMPELGRCWDWTGHLSLGYGKFRLQGSRPRAHRLSYQHHIGPIPEGFVVDHLCRNRACVRPSHLEPKTILGNIMARGSLSPTKENKEKTHCINGHPFSETNTILYGGGRHCRACNKTYSRNYYYKKTKPEMETKSHP